MDSSYIPIHVGKSLSSVNLHIQGDNTGCNISNLNNFFCELTGLYWVWKNVDARFYALSHYRRYFKPIKQEYLLVNDKKIASSNELLRLMKSYDVILPQKRNYYIDTIRSHYVNAHNKSDLDVTYSVICHKFPDYIESFQNVFNSRSISLYNMFVMNRKSFNNYCEWLFSVLFEVEKMIPYKNYDQYQRRVFGFLAERLLNVWIAKNNGCLNVIYLPIVNIEGENLGLKAYNLIKRKLSGD